MRSKPAAIASLSSGRIWRTTISEPSRSSAVRGRWSGRSLTVRGKTRLGLGAGVAQLVEHFIRNEGVPGSSPGAGLVNSATRRLDGAGQRGRDPDGVGRVRPRGHREGDRRSSHPSARSRRPTRCPGAGPITGPEGFADLLACRRRATSTSSRPGPRRCSAPTTTTSIVVARMTGRTKGGQDVENQVGLGLQDAQRPGPARGDVFTRHGAACATRSALSIRLSVVIGHLQQRRGGAAHAARARGSSSSIRRTSSSSSTTPPRDGNGADPPWAEVAPQADQVLRNAENAGFALACNQGRGGGRRRSAALILQSGRRRPHRACGEAIRLPSARRPRDGCTWMGPGDRWGRAVGRSTPIRRSDPLHRHRVGGRVRVRPSRTRLRQPREVRLRLGRVHGRAAHRPGLGARRNSAEIIFDMIHEDVDLSLRVRLTGAGVGIEPDARASTTITSFTRAPPSWRLARAKQVGDHQSARIRARCWRC